MPPRSKQQRMRAAMAIPPRHDPATWGPADKTRPRVDPDPIVMLAKAYRNDKSSGISPDQERAAREIARVWYWVTSRLMARAADMNRIRAGLQAEPSLDTRDAYTVNYLPWADEMSARGKQTGLPFLEVCVDLAVERMSPNKIDVSRGWRSGRAIVLIREALQRYCEIAGWVRR